MAKSKKRRKVVVFSVIVLVLAGLGLGAALRKREVIITVQTEKVTRRTLVETVKASGKIQPVVKVAISPEVSGEIVELPVKEGQHVQKGDLILKIKKDFYEAARNQAEGAYQSSLAGKATAEANLVKARADYKRSADLFKQKLISDSDYDAAQNGYDVAKAQLSSAEHMVKSARGTLDSTEDTLAKTIIVSPLTGTVSKLNSELGERVVGTATMAGTEVMTIADLNEMEARVDLGETDVILIAPGQCVHLEVDAFKDKKFNGIVTQIANSSKTAGSSGSGNTQDATKFEVRIRIKEKDAFRPGMSVTAEIETRYRTNVLAVPMAAVTTRVPKEKKAQTRLAARGHATDAHSKTNSPSAATNADPPAGSAAADDPTNTPSAGATNAVAAQGTNVPAGDKKSKEAAKPIEVVFLKEGDHARMVPVKVGIGDDNYWEITQGLQEGQEIVSGGYKAIVRDLDDGKKVRKGVVGPDQDKDKDKEGK